MNANLFKRTLALLLAAMTCFACTACKSESDTTTTEDTATTATQGKEESAPSTAPQETEEEIVIEIPEGELLGLVDGWRGSSETGKLTERDQFSVVNIKSKKDLDPYRAYIANFTEEDEKAILSDSGACILIELTGATEYTLYGTASITQVGNAITVFISVDEAEDPLPKHTYFLIHIPEKHYNGEIIEVAF